MAKTLAEKVWDAHVVRKGEGEGANAQPDLLFIDLHLVHEVTSPQAFDGLRLAGRGPQRLHRLVQRIHIRVVLPRRPPQRRMAFVVRVLGIDGSATVQQTWDQIVRIARRTAMYRVPPIACSSIATLLSPKRRRSFPTFPHSASVIAMFLRA